MTARNVRKRFKPRVYIEYMAPALSKYSYIKSYSTADKALGKNKTKVIGNNTELVEDPSGSISVELHGHRVLTFRRNNDIVLDSAGWKTSTTKDRLNRYTPNSVSIHQRDGVWYVKVNGKEQEFRDGMVI